MNAQRLSPDWVLTIVDRNDRVVARSRDHVRFVGQLAPEPFRSSETGDSGIWVGPNLDGTTVLGAYERSPLAGWRAFVGLPATIAEGPLRRSLWLIGALGAWSLGLSYVLAVPFGSRIATSAQALASAAGHLGRGEPVQPVTSGLKEMDEVSRTLASASSDLRQREAALKASESRLRATHDNAGVGIVEVDKDGRLLYVNEARCKMSGHARSELLGRKFADFTPADDPDEDSILFRRQVAGELGAYTLEKRHVRADGSVGWARMSTSAVQDDKGQFVYAVRVIEDITERKEAEFRQSLLIEELNHRVKNTLATVQSLAFQTFRGAASPENGRERFEARLMALSRTHNLLNESSWTGASLSKVLAQELEPYAGDRQGRLTTRGPELELGAPAAVAIGMICHELATNAAKHGALSATSGRLSVEWTVAHDKSAASTLHLRWIERNGPAVAVPQRRGFGSRLIEQTAKQQLNGRVALHFEPNGLVCELEVPLGSGEESAAEAAE
jgi:PAS domain S-box-containing protein